MAAEKIVAHSFDKAPPFPEKFEIVKKTTLNFTDIELNNNKFYSAEVQVAADGQARLFSNYGRVGAPKAAKEVRVCRNAEHASELFDKLIREKTKKGYREVKLIKADVGSDLAKTKVETDMVSAQSLERVGIKLENKQTSSLAVETQNLIRAWFGSTAQFVAANLNTQRCPLGQLSVAQIVKGKDILEEASAVLSQIDIPRLNRLTSDFYTNIPHVLPRIIEADKLRLDSIEKIDRAMSILEVFSDAKSLGDAMVSNVIDNQYKSLGCDLEVIDKADPTYKWIEKMVHQTRASNHGSLGKIIIHNIFRANRHDEFGIMMENSSIIAKSCEKHILPDMLKKLVPERPDINDDIRHNYRDANIFPLFHGSRTENMCGIASKGMLIRPPGVKTCGKMYGAGIYFGYSSKAINYTSCTNSYWARGDSKRAYVFLCDVATGNKKIVSGSHQYSLKELGKDYHSVWAKASPGVLINDEFIVYNPAGKTQQHCIKYIIEFEAGGR